MNRTQQNRFFLLLVRASLGLAATSLLFQFWSRPTLAVSPPQTQLQTQEPIKRQLSYGYDPPLVIKIKRISKIDTAEFPNDFEVDIQNVGEKPIYYMRWYLRLPEVEVGGSDLAFSIDCGNSTLLELNKTPNPDDEPIKPGENYTVKIGANQLKNYAKFMQDLAATRGGPVEITKVELSLFLINFGDGTGYIMGEPNGRAIK